MEPINLIPWVLVGAIAGWLASKTIKSDFWSIFDTLIGMMGAVAGGFLFSTFGQSGATGFSLVSIFAAFVGAVLLLLITRVFSRTPRIAPPVKNDGI